jgi:hypothetical protein
MDTELTMNGIMVMNQDISLITTLDQLLKLILKLMLMLPLLTLTRLIYYAHFGMMINVLLVTEITLLIPTEDVKEFKMNVNTGKSAETVQNVLTDGQLKMEFVFLL